MSGLVLFDYWRSSAAYRVRIALNLKGLAYEARAVNLLPGRDEQLAPAFLKRNPNGRVPVLATDTGDLTQSVAILEYLDEIAPDPPLLPADPWIRAQSRAFALGVACDIHPLNNLVIQKRLRAQFGADDEALQAWGRYWIGAGLAALEASLAGRTPSTFAFGEAPTMADICLVPQMYNARRAGLATTDYPRLHRIDEAARAHPAFAAAAPERQPDAPKDA
jgi:maleylacetoacetate isomerase